MVLTSFKSPTTLFGMKCFTLIAAFLFGIIATSQAQSWQMSFCTELDTTVKTCANNASEFQWKDEKLPLYITVTNGESLNIEKLFFKIFDMKNDKDGEIYADLRSSTRPEWKNVNKRIYFVKPGYYKIELYDISNKRLAESFITIMGR